MCFFLNFQCSCSFRCLQQGLGEAQRYEDSFFLFHINDTNNKAPKFVNRENPKIGKIEFSVQEEQNVNEEVGILLAHDEDINPLFNKVCSFAPFDSMLCCNILTRILYNLPLTLLPLKTYCSLTCTVLPKDATFYFF